MATSVTDARSGITWGLDGDYNTGQFITGDWWVENGGSPVGITSITGGGTGHSGSVDNHAPGSAHGFHDQPIGGFASGYSSSLDVSRNLPYSLAAGHSLTSVLCGTAGTRPVVNDCAVLTCLSSAPAATAFRPPYAGSSKPIYDSDDLDYTKLLSLTPVGSPPDITDDVLGASKPSGAAHSWWTGMPILDSKTGWQGDYLHPRDAMSHNYAGSMARDFGESALLLQLDTYTDEEKATLLLRLVQHGIDCWGIFNAGGSYAGIGGTLGVGRMLPIIFAGYMLNDSTLLNYATTVDPRTVWQEAGQIFYNAQDARDGDDIDWGQNYHPGFYDQWPLGTPTWGENYWLWVFGGYSPNFRAPPGKIDYLGITLASGRGTALLVRLLGLETEFNCDVFLDWQDENFGQSTFPETWGNTWVEAMWSQYRDSTLTVSISPASGTYESSVEVTLTPSSGSAYYTTDGSTPTTGSTLYSASFTLNSSATVKAIAYDDPDTSPVSQASYTITAGAAVETPTISPNGGSFLSGVQVTLNTGTADAGLYYTLDGSTPTSGDTLYSGPFTLSQSATVRVIGIKAGLEDSQIANADFDVDLFVTEVEWLSIPITQQTGEFVVQFNARPSQLNLDAVVGFGPSVAAAYTDLATIVRFNPGIEIDVRNAGAYASDVSTEYSANIAYLIKFTIDVPNNIYSVDIDGVRIATDYAFRSEHSATANLDYLILHSEAGSITVSDVEFDPQEPAVLADAAAVVFL